MLVAGHVGEDPQLDLRVVGRDQDEVRAAGHERPPDPPAELAPDRDVLEVGIGRREPAVAATAWWNVVWSRPSTSAISVGSAST